MEDYLISMGVAILLLTIKNPANKEKMRKICKKIHTEIEKIYPEFSTGGN